MSGLVLSVFPGIGLFDRAFEAEGFCVVRGPDLLWGGDVRSFHVPSGCWSGVIGGPPCRPFIPIANVNRARWGEGSVGPDLIPEFRRVVLEARPDWWVMENSPHAYSPLPDAHELMLDNAWLGERQARRRKFWSSLRLRVDLPAVLPADAGSERTVSSQGSVDWEGSRKREPRRSVADMLELQGFPRDTLDHCPLTVGGAKQVVANGVPLPMGLAIARAVKAALDSEARRIA